MLMYFYLFFISDVSTIFGIVDAYRRVNDMLFISLVSSTRLYIVNCQLLILNSF